MHRRTRPDAVEHDERGPDVTARIAAEREDRTRACDVELAADRRHNEANDEETRPITHARDGMTLAALLERDAPLAGRLRPVLAAERRETMGDPPAQRR